VQDASNAPHSPWHGAAIPNEVPRTARAPIHVAILGVQRVLTAGLTLLFQKNERFVVEDLPTAEMTSLPFDESAFRNCDVVILDIDGGTEHLLPMLAPTVTRGTRILILAGTLSRDTLALAFRNGVTGAVLKNEAPEALFDAVQKVHEGQVWLDTASTTQLITCLTTTEPSTSAETRLEALLTRRERQVVPLVGEGLRNMDIGNRLSISEVTVRNHLTSIFRKLELSSRFELALYALKHGLSKLPPT
jgi:two-component system nitrate/nitrite response regulator NarL